MKLPLILMAVLLLSGCPKQCDSTVNRTVSNGPATHPVPVPEPATLTLTLLGVAAVAAKRRKQ